MQQYIPSQSLIKDQLNQIRMLTNELQAKESETSLLKDELTRLSDTCYSYERQSESLESRYKFILEENEMKHALLNEELNSLKQQKQALKNQSLDLQQKILSFARELKLSQEESDIQMAEKEHLQQEIERYKQEIYHWELENEHLTSKLTQKNEFLARNEKEIQSLKTCNNGLSNELIGLKEEINQQAIEMSEKNSVIGSLKRSMQDYSQISEDYERLLTELESNRIFIEDANRKIQELNNELILQTNEYEGQKTKYEGNIREMSDMLTVEREKIMQREQDFNGFVEKVNGEQETKRILETDLKNLIMLLETKKSKGAPNFEIRSDNLHINVIKSKILELLNEKDRAIKQAKKLTKNQQFLLDDVKTIHEKLFHLSSLAQNQESSSFQNLKVQYEEKLNEIDKAYIDKEARLEHTLKAKDKEMAQMNELLNDHVSLIKQKEQEKMELLGLITTPQQNNGVREVVIGPEIIQRGSNQDMRSVNMRNLDINVDISDLTHVISVLLQIIAYANDKYKDLLVMKKGYKIMLEYFLMMNGTLKELDNDRFRNKKPVKRFRKVGLCVIFCEVLFKMWNNSNLKAYKSQNPIRLDFKNFTQNHILNLLPKIYSLNNGLENQVNDLINQRLEVHTMINSVIKLMASPNLGNRRINFIGCGINPSIINIDVKKLKNIVLNQKEKQMGSFMGNFNKENENKIVLLGEENEYIKGKLQELNQKMEMLILENNNMKQLLDDSENKRSILIQNFKELEKHAQVLNSENQILKNET